MTSGILTRSVSAGLLFALLLQLSACTTTRTASEDLAEAPQELELKAGDEIRVITGRRERFKLRITEIRPGALAGVTLAWKASKTPPDQHIEIAYTDLAFIQIDTPNPAATAGLVASVALIGGLVAAVSAVPIVVMP